MLINPGTYLGSYFGYAPCSRIALPTAISVSICFFLDFKKSLSMSEITGTFYDCE
jgi:hypothetical protein